MTKANQHRNITRSKIKVGRNKSGLFLDMINNLSISDPFSLSEYVDDLTLSETVVKGSYFMFDSVFFDVTRYLTRINTLNK